MLSKADIQRLRALQEKKHRDAAGLFAVEGEKVVAELLAEGFPFTECYATPAWKGSARTPCPATVVTDAEMARISHFPTPSTILAVARMNREALAPEALNTGLTLALDTVQDAGNVGTLLRIADWYAFDRVLLSPECADPYSSKVINASKASFSRVPFFTAPLSPALAALTVPVLGCDLNGDSVHQLPAFTDAVVVIGSEGRGLSPDVRQKITRFVTIPRFGAAESLNAGVAAGIICDQLRRPRAP